ncbi:hypothetical protein M3Y98_00436700 [Aphelenchoides besseyi]|nr:hypothetical protein M3Y98_00436700 [Aphelenchoides besseyi]KAI6202309.1 hypothetical protein M3Y96_00934500 [Aphelenchoides besseyi]
MEEEKALGSTKSTKTASSSSSEVGSFNEENLVELLKSQVDHDTIEEILSAQRKTLDRFEKTNEMLATCRSLSEKRMEDTRKQFSTGKETINQAKADLESIFRRLKTIKQALANRYPDIYAEQVEQVDQLFPPEEED